MNGDWARVGTAVRDRRHEVDLTQKEAALQAGVSDTTWLSLESGKPVSLRTARRACKPLRWTTDSVDRLLAGKDPVEEFTPDDLPLEAQVVELRERVSELEALIREAIEGR